MEGRGQDRQEPGVTGDAMGDEGEGTVKLDTWGQTPDVGFCRKTRLGLECFLGALESSK